MMTGARHCETYPDLHRVMLAAVMDRRALTIGKLLCHMRKAELRVLCCKRTMQRFSMCFCARLTGMKSFQARKAAEVLLCCILNTASAHMVFRVLRNEHQCLQPCMARLEVLHRSTCSPT